MRSAESWAPELEERAPLSALRASRGTLKVYDLQTKILFTDCGLGNPLEGAEGTESISKFG